MSAVRAQETGPVPVEEEQPGPTRAERLSGLAQQHGALVTLIVAVIAASLSFDTFLTGDNLENMAVSSAFLAVVALGMTFVIITGGIDLGRFGAAGSAGRFTGGGSGAGRLRCRRYGSRRAGG
ncbi:hypothetical protein [Streptomyces sp. H27-D2]|uniref:hypothetical protein n=1 Tax=Streptomyces sp. H27-D2 TaxID=3046304 RepID=UPI003FA6ED79